MLPADDALQSRIRDVYAETGDKSETARRLGISRTTVKKYTNPTAPAEARTLTGKTTGSETESKIELDSDRRIQTLEDAVAFAEVDTSVWRVKKWSCTSWEVVLKLKTDGVEKPIRKSMWRVSLDLERILPKPLHDGIEAAFESMKAHAPRYPAISYAKPKDPHLLVVDIYDVHLGKLCWSPEVGVNYDLKIAESVYRNAVEDLLSKASGFPIERIILPIGNDFFHIDNFTNSTTNLTPQDVSGRFQKIYRTGFMAKVWAIELMLRVAPVEIYWIPGNHDKATSWFLTEQLKTHFHHCRDFEADTEPKTRKYVRWENTLIGFSHGDKIPKDRLQGVMANERRHDWAATECHEWHQGHRHRSKVTKMTPVDTHDGVVIRELASLSASDAWHFNEGYVGGPRAADCFLYSAKDGFSGHFSANARE